jgi:transmembrane sensor
MALEFFSRSKPVAVAEQAAEWLIEFECGPLSDAQRREFVAWLKRSPVHVEEFLQISAIHDQLGDVPALKDSLEDLLAEAEETVVMLPGAPQADEVGDADERHPSLRFALAAGVLILVGGSLLASLLVMGNGEKTYRTGFGEQRSIPLDDGTVLALNTASEVRVRLGKQQRSATLVAGEAMFDVAKDATRPFTVSAGPLDIRVVGTRFNIYRQAEQTTLTVLEGKVDVAPVTAEYEVDAQPAIKRQLAAGEQIVVAVSGKVIDPPKVNVERAAAWTARRVIFDDEPLSGVISEFNRYNSRTLTVSDPVLAKRRVSGVFKVHDVDVLISFLQKQQDIRVIEEEENLRIVLKP